MPDYRSIRLKNEYQQMLNISKKGSIIQIESLEKGRIPYVDKYLLRVAARTVIATSPLKYRTIHDIMVDIPSDYPSTAPFVKMLSSPYVFHPNWYSDGRWCHGKWSETEGLGDFIVRMVKTLFYDREITNPESPANTNANDWYKNKDNAPYFPTPPLNLPDPSGRSFKIQRKFSISK